jgi:hypothetical protein
MSFKHALSRRLAIPWQLLSRGRTGRGLALLAVSGVLGLSGVIASSAPPAGASTFFVTLSASPTTLAPGQATTLTATSNTDVGPTPYWIEIFDLTTDTLVGTACGSGTVCTATVSQNVATTQQYVAYIADFDPNGIAPPSGIQATSDTSYVTWNTSGYRITLSGPASTPIFGGDGTYTATTNMSITGLGDTIEIVDETTGDLMKENTASPCVLTFQPGINGDYLVAFLTGHTSAVSNVLYTAPGP